MSVQTLPRKFIYNGIELDDPGSQYSPDEVREFYSEIYPELQQAIAEEPVLSSEAMTYTFSKYASTKGKASAGVTVFEIAGGFVPFHQIAVPGKKLDSKFMDQAGELLTSTRGQAILPPSEFISPI